MKNLVVLIVCLSVFSIFSVSAFGQSLYVNPNDDNLKNIENSKYLASSINVLRNSNGELVSVVKTEASKFLPHPITDQFLDTLPIVKEGIISERNIQMRQISVDYDYQNCISEMYDVPGYTEQCNWYHRAYVTSLGITNDVGERFEIFRGLNHSYTVKPGDSVTSFWTIITND
ncbi:hypothetical protein OAK66_04685 [Candidatus Nitrosopelagicus sp.]|jgi:hypothetical protein|nr:hypothetical protein [Candidatus Nitrosopelagicus sp.]MDC0241706.1 hypothetical protein [Candidatus Nitrosopelagicus sp.]